MDEVTVVQYARRYLAGEEMLEIAREAGFKTSAPVSTAFKALRERYGENTSGASVKRQLERVGTAHVYAGSNAAYLYTLRLAVVRWNHLHATVAKEKAA